jgi:hypothetical protein
VADLHLSECEVAGLLLYIYVYFNNKSMLAVLNEWALISKNVARQRLEIVFTSRMLNKLELLTGLLG